MFRLLPRSSRRSGGRGRYLAELLLGWQGCCRCASRKIWKRRRRSLTYIRIVIKDNGVLLSGPLVHDGVSLLRELPAEFIHISHEVVGIFGEATRSVFFETTQLSETGQEILVALSICI